MTKPANDNKKSSGWTKPDPEQAANAEYEKLKAACEGVQGSRLKDENGNTIEQEKPAEKLEFTRADVFKAFNLGQWYGKRWGQLYSLQRTVPHIEKQNTRLQKAGRKVGILKQALRAQIDANTLAAEALDD
jgi:hypothetical protein